MVQIDVYVLFFDIAVTNYCIKDVCYEPDVLNSLCACLCVCVCACKSKVDFQVSL